MGIFLERNFALHGVCGVLIIHFLPDNRVSLWWIEGLYQRENVKKKRNYLPIRKRVRRVQCGAGVYFHFTFNKIIWRELWGGGRFIGRVIIIQIVYPIILKHPFEVKKNNYFTLFYIILHYFTLFYIIFF